MRATEIDEDSKPKRARRVAVLVPTTGGLARVVDLAHKPHLGQSIATGIDDFRPLPIAEGYHRLVDGALKALGDSPSPCHLVIEGAVDDGRSWELPVLLAHRIVRHGAEIAAVEDADWIVWATGSVDGALNPTGEARYVGEKLGHSAGALARRRADAIVAFALADPAEADRAAIERALPPGGRLVLLDGFESVEALAREAAGVVEPATSPAPPRPPRRGMGRVAVLVLLALIVAGAIAFGLSILAGKGERERDVSASLSIERLTAADRAACVEAQMTGAALAARPVAIDGARIGVPATQATCALRFTNTGAAVMAIGLDSALAGSIIEGDSPMGRPITLSPGARYLLVFRAPPVGRTARLTVAAEGAEEALALEFEGTP
ncbi:hypothetical protein [Acuticoccus kandeliae]|uniref:hypothetical protein n=1 Tax=Acuticoccus kandeliae TaxID=2073160 RepID=UPI000D3E37C5|nr:hypothetical protein [Acuticoccus kandeliae]